MGVDNSCTRRDFLKLCGASLGGLGLCAAGFRPASADGSPTPTPIPLVEINVFPANNDLNRDLDEFSSKWQKALMGTVKNSLPSNSTTDLSAVFQTLIDKIVSHVGNECNNNPRKSGNHDADFTRLLFDTLANQVTPEQFMNGVDDILVLNRSYTKVKTGETRWEQAVFIKHRYTSSNGKLVTGSETSWSIFNFKQAGNYGKNGDYILSSSGTNFYIDKIPEGLSNVEKAKLAKEMQRLNNDVKNANRIYGKNEGIAVIREIKDRLKQSPLVRAANNFKPINGAEPSRCNDPSTQPIPIAVEAPQTVPQANPQASTEFTWQPVTVVTETAGLTMMIAFALLGGALALRTRTA